MAFALELSEIRTGAKANPGVPGPGLSGGEIGAKCRFVHKFFLKDPGAPWMIDMEKPTVYLVEDDPDVRGLVEKLLTSAGLHVLSFAHPDQFLEAYDADCFGCAVVDVCLPGMTGLELQSTLADPERGRPHIMLSGHADVSMAVLALTHGAMGFLEKPFRTTELLQLVHKAIEIDRLNREKKRKRQEIMRRLDSLTSREREVLDFVVQGEQNKTIAAQLDISQRTVELHRSRVMEKLEADSIAELVQLMIAYGDTRNPHN